MVSPIGILFQPYLVPPPESRAGFKRFWDESRGITPGRWNFRSYTLQDAIFIGPFEFDEEGARWNKHYDEWVPRNDLLADHAWQMGIDNSVHDEIIERDVDFKNFKFRVLKVYGPASSVLNRRRPR